MLITLKLQSTVNSEVPLVRPTSGHRSGRYMEVVLIARHKYNEIQ